MKNFLIAALIAFSASLTFAQKASLKDVFSVNEQPKLVVGVVIDQMRYEYLYRFYNHFGDDGFKRLRNQGFEFRNAHYNYVPTYTAPGHASIYTGTTPRVHGIISNDWYDKYNDKSTYCVSDEKVVGVGGSGKIGMRSPFNLKSSTITDELRLFYQNRSKVIGISIKDRGAILPAGHHPNGAYWYDGSSGDFITSTFYTESLPQWLVDFNNQKLAQAYMNQKWKTYGDISTYIESSQDDRSYELSLKASGKATFPYNLKQISKSGKATELIRSTPFGNSLLTDLALAALEGEGLGQDNVPDMLAVSYSSTDYVGHAFGPYSKEIQDTYIRLDLELARLMNALDEKVGKGKWTMFLTADHAVADIPQYLIEQGQSVNYFKVAEMKKAINLTLKTRFNAENLIANFSNHQVFLNHAVIKEKGLDDWEVKDAIIQTLRVQDGVSGVYDVAELSNYGSDQLDVDVLAAGLNTYMSGDIAYAINPGWLDDSRSGGTTHGSGFTYDTHVPLLFYGWGIQKGSSSKYHPITDIAPSIATLLHIKYPSGATGQPAEELFDQ